MVALFLTTASIAVFSVPVIVKSDITMGADDLTGASSEFIEIFDS